MIQSAVRRVWTHCLPEGSVVWVALPHSVEVDNISPNQKNVFLFNRHQDAKQQVKSSSAQSNQNSRRAFLVYLLCNYFTYNCEMNVFIIKYILSSYDLCRYGTGQRSLLPYEPHLSVDITSSGESSSGFTSQDSTMERCKTGTSPLKELQVIKGYVYLKVNIQSLSTNSHFDGKSCSPHNN